MKNLLFILVGFVLLTSCGKDDSKDDSKAVSPCSLLSEAEIKRILSLPEEAPTTMEDKVYTYPTCSYEWETVTYEASMEISGQVIEYEEPYKLMIVLVANASKSMYETSISVYKDAEKITGLGEMATWGEKMSQVSFLANGNLVHLNLKISGVKSENKEKAIELAKLVAKRL